MSIWSVTEIFRLDNFSLIIIFLGVAAAFDGIIIIRCKQIKNNMTYLLSMVRGIWEIFIVTKNLKLNKLSIVIKTNYLLFKDDNLIF